MMDTAVDVEAEVDMIGINYSLLFFSLLPVRLLFCLTRKLEVVTVNCPDSKCKRVVSS